MQNIRKVYHAGSIQVPALAGIDLSIELGEFLCIMGPSGSGKSTLMNILGCLDAPTSGTYYLADEDVSQLDPDEPTGNLDTRTSAEIMMVFRNLNRDRRITFILVTHDPEVGDLTDRRILIRNGRIEGDERKAGVQP